MVGSIVFILFLRWRDRSHVLSESHPGMTSLIYLIFFCPLVWVYMVWFINLWFETHTHLNGRQSGTMQNGRLIIACLCFLWPAQTNWACWVLVYRLSALTGETPRSACSHMHTQTYKDKKKRYRHTHTYIHHQICFENTLLTMSRAVFGLSGTRARLLTFHTIPGLELAQRLPLCENNMLKTSPARVKSPHQVKM